MKKKILMVGCGRMGGALLSAWKDAAANLDIFVVDPHIYHSGHNLANLSTLSGVYLTASELPEELNPDYIILAVKPQMMADVLKDYLHYISESCFVSIAAGLELSFYQNHLGQKVKFVRIMPNTPVCVKEGFVAAFASETIDDVIKEDIEWLFSQAARFHWVDDEDKFHAITAISGSGPAYVFAFIEAMYHAAFDAGFDEEFALDIAKQTVYGAAKMAIVSDESLDDLRHHVTSKGGTTEAGLEKLLPALNNLIERTITAARKRSVQLSK